MKRFVIVLVSVLLLMGGGLIATPHVKRLIYNRERAVHYKEVSKILIDLQDSAVKSKAYPYRVEAQEIVGRTINKQTGKRYVIVDKPARELASNELLFDFGECGKKADNNQIAYVEYNYVSQIINESSGKCEALTLSDNTLKALKYQASCDTNFLGFTKESSCDSTLLQ